MDLLITLLYLVFVLSAIVLIVVILLQEGRGGGFGTALGEHGQQTFGVGARGINTFTGYTAGVFLVSAVLIHIFTRQQEVGTVVGDPVIEAPTDAGLGTPPGVPPIPPPAGGGN